VNFELWFTFFLSSQISGEPVNHGSQITPAPGPLRYIESYSRMVY
jgi:hypothetical protein